MLRYCLLVLAICCYGVVAAQKQYSFQAIQRKGLQYLTEESDGKALKEHKAALFLFLSPECPLCKNYGLVLKRIYEEYGSRIQMIGIFPGSGYSAEEIKNYLNKYGIGFSAAVDPKFKLSSYLEATITPEAVLIDPEGWMLYRGAIDDWVVTLGRKKVHPEKEYLKDAIAQYLSHNPVLIRQTSPKGCLINEF